MRASDPGWSCCSIAVGRWNGRAERALLVFGWVETLANPADALEEACASPLPRCLQFNQLPDGAVPALSPQARHVAANSRAREKQFVSECVGRDTRL